MHAQAAERRTHIAAESDVEPLLPLSGARNGDSALGHVLIEGATMR
jgi:hypothetical protein